MMLGKLSQKAQGRYVVQVCHTGLEVGECLGESNNMLMGETKRLS